MDYHKEELKRRLLDIYPDLKRVGVSVELQLDDKRDSWILSFTKGHFRKHAFLHQKDAQACMEGNMCIYLWGIVEQYIKETEN